MSRIGWVPLIAGVGFVLLGGSIASGQGVPDDVFSGGGGGISGGAGRGIPILPLQILGFVLLSATAFALSFFVIFPSRLKKRNPAWSRDAYGFAWACLLGAMSLGFLAIFWKDMVLTRIFPGVRSTVPDLVNHYALKGAVMMIAVLIQVAIASRYRSEAKAAQVAASR
ncbi:hypothetical protein BH23PLA1_BH23PLA1_13930 [soil metagenome]